VNDHEIATRITAAVLLPEPGQRAAAVRDLIAEIEQEHVKAAEFIENCRIEELAELNRVRRELGAAQRAGYHVPSRDAEDEPVESPVKYVPWA
jgi:hypothetical protein